MRRPIVLVVFALTGCSIDASGTADPTDLGDSTFVDTAVAMDSLFVVDDTASPATDTAVSTDSSEPPDTFTPPDTAVALDTEPVDVPCPTCPALATCMAGACVCPTNSRACSAGCIDEKADPNRCGSCDLGLPCNYGSMCANGVCACQPGLTLCGGVCTDTKGHALACGGCTPCGSGKRCRDGICVDESGTSCPSSRPDECASGDGRKSCFDTKRDPMHCGGCATDKRCSADEFCVDGACEKYAVGVGCTSCPCPNCATILPGSRCCLAPPGSASGRVMCVDAATCPAYLP
jgi:hypothetical protein